MAFTRINGGSWAVGDKLTSAQANSLDVDHANAVDKTVAGDTLSGVLVTAGAGRFSHGGSDYNTFSASRTRAIWQPPIPIALTTGWTVDGIGVARILGPATGTQINFPITSLHNGAVLTSVTAYVQVVAHASVPAALPNFIVQRQTLAQNAVLTTATLASGGFSYFPTPGSGAAWRNSGNMQAWSITCDQNNTIDRSQYAYSIQLYDESGANSQALNAYYGFELTFGSITDMRFP